MRFVQQGGQEGVRLAARADRILFGSDAPWQDAGKVLEEFLTLPLGRDEQEAICFRNAAELFKISLP